MIWDTCHGSDQICPIHGLAYRLVESQEQVATRSMVDTLDEQALLEVMLDEVKPPYPPSAEGYHYLLCTPFRYPPLPYGSRFGGRDQPSLFYAAKSVTTSLAETAYYRGVYLYSMSEPPSHPTRTEHSLFTVGYETASGIQLQNPPFNQYQDILTHIDDYHETQGLGKNMREAGVEGFEYVSARDPNHGICIALFDPAPFIGKTPLSQEIYFCDLSSSDVVFKEKSGNDIFRYSMSRFLRKDGTFPRPAL